MRLVRWLRADSLWLVTNRCECEMFLLTPTARKNELIGGWLARALERYGDGIELYAFVFLSNHFHLLLRDTKGQLPKVMWYFQTNLAKEINLALGRPTGRVFGRRYHATLLRGDQVFLERWAYVTANAVKAGLVRRASSWPGLSSLESSLSGSPMSFRLLDRTALHNALRSGKPVKRSDFIKTHALRLAVPPMLADFGRKARREFLERLVSDFEAEQNAQRKAEGKGFLGVAKVLSQRPMDRPLNPSFSPRIPVTADDEEQAAELLEAWIWVTNSYQCCFYRYRKASRFGNWFRAKWPEWTCPPSCMEPVGCTAR
jgi:REP element-mobilizing transposase RayT